MLAVRLGACLRQARPIAPVSGGEAGQRNFRAQSTHKRTMPIGVGTKPVAPLSDFGKDASQRAQLSVSCESSCIWPSNNIDTGGEFAPAYFYQQKSASLPRDRPCFSELLKPVCRGSFRPFLNSPPVSLLGLGQLEYHMRRPLGRLGQYRGEMSPVAASPLVSDRDISMLDEGKEVGLCLPHRKNFRTPVARKKGNGGRNVWQEGRLKVVGVFPWHDGLAHRR